MGSMNKDSAFRLLGAIYEAGGNFIDTANIYQNEQSEAEASQNRDSLVLATKFTMDYRSHAIGKGPELPTLRVTPAILFMLVFVIR